MRPGATTFASKASLVLRQRSGRRVLAALAFVILVFLLKALGVTRALDNSITAQFFSFTERSASGEIVLIDIDARSLSEIGEWPWRRSIHAELIQKLADAGAADIVFDVDFSARSLPQEDEHLAQAIEEAGGVVLAAFVQPADASSTSLIVNRPIDEFDAYAWPAVVNVRTDNDGRVRTMPYGLFIENEPLQSVAALLSNSNESAEGEFRIDFSISADTFPRISVIDVLGEKGIEIVEGRKVLIGANARELRDFFLVPHQGVIAGHELQAVAAETLLQQRVLKPSSLMLELSLISLITAIGLCFVFFANSRVALFAIAVLTASLFVGAFWLQHTYAYTLAIGGAVLSLLALVVWKAVRELDFGSVLLAVWKGRATNHKLLLDSVVDDNVEGVLIVSEGGRVLKESSSAKSILRSPELLTGSLLYETHPQLAKLAKYVVGKLSKGEQFPKNPLIYESYDREGNRLVIEAVATPSKMVETDDETGNLKEHSIVVSLMFRDITARKVAEERLSFLAQHHEKTGLLSRSGLLQAIGKARKKAVGKQSEVTASFRLEGLEQFESSLGYDLALKLINAVGARISNIAPKESLIAALEDSLLVLVFYSDDSKEFLSRQLEEVAVLLSEPYDLGSHSGVLNARCGFFANAKFESAAETALKNANSAMHQAGVSGARSLLYNESIKRAIVERQTMETELRRAIAQNQFFIQYHPIVDLRTGRIDTVEALIRWKHPQDGLIPPGKFIPVAEEAGLIEHIGRRVLHLVCRDLKSLPPHLKAAVNISPAHFLSKSFVPEVLQILSRHGLATNRFDLELTETIAAGDLGLLSEKLEESKDAGFLVSLDDFGTGYSSLSYLRSLNVDKLKIDMEFAKDLGTAKEAEGIIRAITNIANELELRTVLEGIETREQALLARKCGVTYGQGYLFSKPIGAASLTAFFEKWKKAA